MANKLVIIGLDSATFDVLDDWIDDNRLPNLKKIKDRGVYGNLKSSIHPISPVAWTTFLTGRNPGKHGIYDFQKRVGDSYDWRIAGTDDIKSKTFVESLDENNIGTCTVNLPMTYPPFKLNRGLVISGMLSGEDFTHPPDLKDELEDKLGEYLISPGVTYSGKNEDRHIKSIFDVLEYRINVLKYLIENKEFSFLVSNFQVVDQAQHWYWKHMVNNDEEHGNEIYRVFKRIDGFIGDLLKMKNTNVIIMSDHGMGELKGAFYVNNWLAEEGFLKFKRTPRVMIKKAFHKLGLTVQNLYKISARLGLVDRSKDMKRESRDKLLDKITLSFEDIDWGNTQAFSSGHMGQIYINRKGDFESGSVVEDEYEETRDRIIDRLRDLKDEGRNGIIKSVGRREGVYEGEAVGEAPDIVFNVDNYRYSTTVNFFEFGSNRVFDECITLKSGEHKPNGIFMAEGPDINNVKGPLKNMNIRDIAPTVLSYFGLPVPNDMDGRILKEIFK